VLKVNHAGEFGAICIYSGQLFIARLTAPSLIPELIEFRSHEKKHMAIFWAELQRRGVRRCRSYYFCGFGGYLLGLFTGLFGINAIAATTVAVERVVLAHLKHKESWSTTEWLCGHHHLPKMQIYSSVSRLVMIALRQRAVGG